MIIYVITFILSSSLYVLILYYKYSKGLPPYTAIVLPIIFLMLHGLFYHYTSLQYSPFLTCYSWLLLHFGLSLGYHVSLDFYQTNTTLSISWLNYTRLIIGFNRKLGEGRDKNLVSTVTELIEEAKKQEENYKELLSLPQI